MDPSKIAIIVLNWNKREDTVACLQSLMRADLGGASVVVVDNGSRDGSVEAIRQQFPGIRVVVLPENRGFAGGNNAGIQLALAEGAEGILLLNNDTEVSPDFLLPLVWAMQAYPMAAGVCSAIHRHDRPEMLDVAYCVVRFGQRDAVQIVGVNALPGNGFDTRREIEVAIGCSGLLRADALRQVGLFDEAYFAYHEDVDWCLRAHRLGYRFYYEPLSRVFHRGSSSTSPLFPRPAGNGNEARLADLPNAEPLPWNPVRTYLGARNLIRLLRAHATTAEKRAFVRSCVYEIPLEFLAVLMRREGWLRLGRFGYRDAFRLRFIEPHPVLRADASDGSRMSRALAFLVLFPADLFWKFPRDIWRARRQGRLVQFCHYLRGLRDGLLNRPIPLERLGLR